MKKITYLKSDHVCTGSTGWISSDARGRGRRVWESLDAALQRDRKVCRACFNSLKSIKCLGVLPWWKMENHPSYTLKKPSLLILLNATGDTLAEFHRFWSNFNFLTGFLFTLRTGRHNLTQVKYTPNYIQIVLLFLATTRTWSCGRVATKDVQRSRLSNIIASGRGRLISLCLTVRTFKGLIYRSCFH